MPIELFDHQRLTISRESSRLKSDFQHFYGGSAAEHGIQFVNAERACHVVYRLDTTDPLVPFSLPNVRMLPLVHGFQYSSNGDNFVYQVLNEKEIKVIAPDPLEFNKNFPYDDYPSHFDKQSVSFHQANYQPKDAASALEYQGIFGIDQLTEAEMQRAVEIALATWHPEKFDDFDWSHEEVVRILGCDPFVQGQPSDSCPNPGCCTKGNEVAKDAPSLKVVAIHQPHDEDETMWGSSCVQLFWQLCENCRCISVNNQCT